jgi:hypothetical protein
MTRVKNSSASSPTRGHGGHAEDVQSHVLTDAGFAKYTNVDFFKKHKADLKQLEGLKQDNDCDEDRENDE